MEQMMNTLKKAWATIREYITHIDRKRRKQLIAGVVAVAVVAGLAALPMLAANKDRGDEPESTIMTATVAGGNLSTYILGGGNLAEEGGEVIRLPQGVKLTEFYVPNYAEVKKGDKLAGVDRVTVMQAISKVQESMDYIKTQLNSAEDGKGTVTIETQTGGIVKAVYAKAGDDVGSVMMEHGALAVLSLDGLMAVDLKTAADIAAGDGVTLRFADGTEARGKVESALDSNVVVTLEDKGYAMDTEVTVLTMDGTELGKSTLYVHNAWRAMATTGTVSGVHMKENDSIKPDRKLLTIKNADMSAEFAKLANQHRDYEQLMLELFVMYQAEALVAPCDGIVTGVDRNSVHLLSDEGGHKITLLANSPDGVEDTRYLHYIGKLMEKGEEYWTLKINPNRFPVGDYLDLTNIPDDEELMIDPVTYVPDHVIYEYKENAWQQVLPEAITVEDVLLFAEDEQGKCVWIVRLPKQSTEEPVPTPTPEPTPNPDEILPGDDFIADWGFGFGGGGGGGYVSPEPPELFEAEGTDLLTVTPQDMMTLTVTLKEQDIGKISMGQTAQVKVSVLKGQTFEGTVTSIFSKTDDQNRLRFYVEITLQRKGDMLNGMSATAAFVGATAEESLLIPVAALNARGTETIVYTALAGEELDRPVAITTGVSDGELVEVLEGLTEGQTIYYAYYEAQEVSNAVAGSGNFFW